MKSLLGVALEDVTKCFSNSANSKVIAKKSMFLIHGDGDMGQAYLGPAILHELESLPSYSIDLPTLLSDASSRSAEESLTRQVTECCSHAPAILYWPHIDLWWDTASESLKTCILMLLDDIPESSKIAVIAVSDCKFEILPNDLKRAFDQKLTRQHPLTRPGMSQRQSFFRQLIAEAQTPPEMKTVPVCVTGRGSVSTVDELSNNIEKGDDKEKSNQKEETLKKQECNALDEEDELILCKLRMFLRNVVERLMKYFKDFVYPVDDPDYRRIIQMPICLVDIRDKINNSVYKTVGQFLTDIDLLVSNAKEYYLPDKFVGRNIINKACHLQDSTFSMTCQFPKGLSVKCDEIQARRELVKAKKSRSNDDVELTDRMSPEAEPQPQEVQTAATEEDAAKSSPSAIGSTENGAAVKESTEEPEQSILGEKEVIEAKSDKLVSDMKIENDLQPPTVEQKSESSDTQEDVTLILNVQEMEDVCEFAAKRTVDSPLKELEHTYLTMLMDIRGFSDSWDRSELPRTLRKSLTV
eukprot:CAMPEP_0170195358 /NCGR_PEP_ID=MMETSP0040_2-20121228/61323_1 /TAXON_ID=641309 /ORGANISM="Lotharella oceanica, Strain CCMP622" /LENGTH=524 /DNA_ID=CAMNT_0010444493 /DNA_START=158 /DNA_END=1732 /DNA_ORIENTATION=-